MCEIPHGVSQITIINYTRIKTQTIDRTISNFYLIYLQPKPTRVVKTHLDLDMENRVS